jgi:hypothetical protein
MRPTLVFAALVLPVSLLAAQLSCTPINHQSFVSPADGQTAVPRDLDLLVNRGALEIPPDYPVGDLIAVVDLDDGGIVPGTVTRDGADLLFHPDEPWRANRRYAWTVGGDDHDPHGPELPVPAALQGTSSFYTSVDVELLAAGLDDDGQACVVLSRPVAGLDRDHVRVTLNDVEVPDATVVVAPPESWDPGYELLGDDPALDVVCVTTATPVDAGAEIRIWWGDRGPWRLTVQDAALSDVVAGLYRGVAQ